MRISLLFYIYLIDCVTSSEENSPRIIIVGSGASGIAAASRLLLNGFSDITIFEAENRIGGRIFSTKIGEYLVDIGAEWVHGEKNNVAFRLAWPLDLLEKSTEHGGFKWTNKIFGSSGHIIPEEIATPLLFYVDEEKKDEFGDINKLKTGSFGEFVEIQFNRYFKKHPEITPDLHKPLLHLLDLLTLISGAGKTWHEISLKGPKDYDYSEGDQLINWKERSYTTILDILMKKYPNPEEELAVKNATKLNTKVTEIKLNKNHPVVKVTTANGQEYFADHVIVTVSLGVLQKNCDKLFSPPLPKTKLNAIKNYSFGHTAKIIIYYDNPWWLDDPVYSRSIYWTEEDRRKIENDPQKRWMLGISEGVRVEYRPKLILFWVTGPYVTEMELIPEQLFRQQVKQFIKKFFGKAYKLTEPAIIKRSLWNTNENFLGTYSFRGLQADAADVHIEDLAEPVVQYNKPVLQFAGEATTHKYSTVHGAIESGWREANRIINSYSRDYASY
ncbi:spermine oxidase [Microplitis demolitor]|uniref:spermine oxidase n=1 Tax=Microplitis demolitor TaxID=69319 RepID=UPI0006D4D512|nr:spermine oxidase [Microplitis demolitor]